MADIRGGARLKKVSDSEKKDRSAALVPGNESSGPSAPASGGGGGGDAGGGLAGALASALAARKSKVSHSGKCNIDASSFTRAVANDFQMTRMTRTTGISRWRRNPVHGLETSEACSTL